MFNIVESRNPTHKNFQDGFQSLIFLYFHQTFTASLLWYSKSTYTKLNAPNLNFQLLNSLASSPSCHSVSSSLVSWNPTLFDMIVTTKLKKTLYFWHGCGFYLTTAGRIVFIGYSCLMEISIESHLPILV